MRDFSSLAAELHSLLARTKIYALLVIRLRTSIACQFENAIVPDGLDGCCPTVLSTPFQQVLL